MTERAASQPASPTRATAQATPAIQIMASNRYLSPSSRASQKPPTAAPLAASMPASAPSAENSVMTARSLMTPLIATGLDRGQQHGQTGQHRKYKHTLYRHDRLVDDRPHLSE